MKYVKTKMDGFEWHHYDSKEKEWVEKDILKHLYMELSETFFENVNYRVKWMVNVNPETGEREYVAICDPLPVETKIIKLAKYDNTLVEMKLNFWERLVYLFTKKLPKRYRGKLDITLEEITKSCCKCANRHSAKCPNSEKCYATEEKPYFEKEIRLKKLSK